MAGFRAINLGWHSALLDPLFWLLSTTGLGWFQVVFSLALSYWPATRRFVVPLVATVALTGIAFADLIKKLLPRERPSNLSVAIVQESIKKGSFVSGHTTTAFAIATMVMLMTLGTRHARWGVVSLVWATGVGLSRIYRGVHWPSDTVAGAGAGALGSALLFLWFEKRGWLDLDLSQGTRGKGQGTSA